MDNKFVLSPERDMDLRESINKLSEYMVILRNRYNYIPVIVQQQNSESQSLEAFKNNKIRPTISGIADSRYTARDCSVMLGITNPSSFDLPDYMGYPIKDAFKGNIRFLEVVINRNGSSNGICPLFFDGATNDFRELALPNEKDKIDRVLSYLRNIRSNTGNSPSPTLFIGNLKKSAKQLQKRGLFHKFVTLFKNKNNN